MGEVADLFASLGLRIDEAAWRKGETKITEVSKALDGAFQDKGGKWRAANGRFLTMKEKAEGAAAGINGMGDAAEGAGRKAKKAGDDGSKAFDGMGTAIKGYLLYLGGHLAYDKLIKFNQGVQDAKISLSAMLQGNLGGDWTTATKNADALYLEFQRFSQTTPVTTQQMLEFGRGVAVATFQAGGSIKDLTTITEMGTVAAKTMGAQSGYAALELTEMLQGNVSRRMRFAQQLLGMAHVTEEQFREMNAKQRLATVTKVLTSEPMQQANRAMAASFSGVTSTLEDKLQIAFGKIGLPLFQAITQAVKEFNEWLDRNAAQIEEVGNAIGHGLVVAFDALSMAIGGVISIGQGIIDWLGQYFDKGEMLEAFLITLGAVVTAFGLQALAAWIMAAWPILLVIAAVTALVFAIRWLMAHPEKVRAAFAAMGKAIGGVIDWIVEHIKEIGVRIEDFFTEDIPDAIRDAFNAIGDLPIIKQLKELVERILQIGNGPAVNDMGPGGVNPTHQSLTPEQIDKLPAGDLNYIEQMSRLSRPDMFVGQPQAMLAPAPRGSSSGVGGVQIGAVNVGDINVHSTSADPVAVAEEAKRVFHRELGTVLSQTMDVV